MKASSVCMSRVIGLNTSRHITCSSHLPFIQGKLICHAPMLSVHGAESLDRVCQGALPSETDVAGLTCVGSRRQMMLLTASTLAGTMPLINADDSHGAEAVSRDDTENLKNLANRRERGGNSSSCEDDGESASSHAQSTDMRQGSSSDGELPMDLTIPLEWDDGVLCARFSIDGRPFRGVVDTGGPFLTVTVAASGEVSDGSGGSNGSCRFWGCWRGEGRPSGLDDTYEMFASQDGEVEWRIGQVELGGTPLIGPQQGCQSNTGTESRIDSRVAADSVQHCSDIVFGVFRSLVMKGGAGKP